MRNTVVRRPLYKSIYGSKTFEIYADSFTSKKKLYKDLQGKLKDSTGNILVTYVITNVCGCVRKETFTKSIREQYKLSDQLQFDMQLSDDDKFVFKEFLNYPKIEEYCSKPLLDSAKGFINLRK